MTALRRRRPRCNCRGIGNSLRKAIGQMQCGRPVVVCDIVVESMADLMIPLDPLCPRGEAMIRHWLKTPRGRSQAL
jgi:hypothetical protein